MNICDEETRTCADSGQTGAAIYDSFVPVVKERRDGQGFPRMLWFVESDGKITNDPLGFIDAVAYSEPEKGTAVFFAADEIAYDGFVADWIMYWARVAMDYCFDRESEAHLDQAEIMARMVLALLAEFGRTFIHEVGHGYQGAGGHCKTYACCFDVAAENSLCGVRATLGLADPPYYLCDGDSIVWQSANPCGQGTYPMLCDVGALRTSGRLLFHRRDLSCLSERVLGGVLS